MSESVLYQFPLNESIRTYLRIEQLFQRCTFAMDYQSEQAGLSFFNALFDLLELLERSDTRQDLIKDLEGQQKSLQRWAESPDVNPQVLSQLQARLQDCIAKLKSQTRLANCLKNDKFLGSIRQRFNIPGGNCCFDVPQLYHWLHRDPELRKDEMTFWLSQLDTLRAPIALLMQLLRDGRPFRPQTARKGFYQESAEGLQLLRILSNADLPVYPTVSGNRHRYTIRFMSTHPDGAASDADIPFKLSVS